MVNQKQAVTNAVLSIFPDYELGGEVTLKSIFTKDTKAQVIAIVAEGFSSGNVNMSAEAQAKYLGDEKALTKYTGGMVDNWVRKNTDFNFGQKYITKNPGSRAGGGDDTVKALRGLLKTEQTPEARAEIETAIKERLAEIKPTKTVEINVDALPEHLKHLAQS